MPNADARIEAIYYWKVKYCIKFILNESYEISDKYQACLWTVQYFFNSRKALQI